jgi:hypothetical protein
LLQLIFATGSHSFPAAALSSPSETIPWRRSVSSSLSSSVPVVAYEVLDEMLVRG